MIICGFMIHTGQVNHQEKIVETFGLQIPVHRYLKSQDAQLGTFLGFAY